MVAVEAQHGVPVALIAQCHQFAEHAVGIGKMSQIDAQVIETGWRRCPIEAFDVTGSEDDRIISDSMHSKWKTWCDETGHHAGSVHKFYKNLTDAFPVIEKKRTKKHGILMYCYYGIKEKVQEPYEKWEPD